MRSLIILFLSTITSSSFADDPSPSVSPFEALRTEYRASLTSLLTTTVKSEQAAVRQCGEAKKSYRLAESELSRITNQLEAPGSELLGEVIVNYTTTLQNFKQNEVVKLEEAKNLAKTAGNELAVAKKKVEAIHAEIVRIDEAIRREREAQTQTSAGYGDKVLPHGFGSSGFLLDALAGEGHSTTALKLSPLPSEFKACFPNEPTADFADAI